MHDDCAGASRLVKLRSKAIRNSAAVISAAAFRFPGRHGRIPVGLSVWRRAMGPGAHEAQQQLGFMTTADADN